MPQRYGRSSSKFPELGVTQEIRTSERFKVSVQTFYDTSRIDQPTYWHLQQIGGIVLPNVLLLDLTKDEVEALIAFLKTL
jgi:hypothetical protein